MDYIQLSKEVAYALRHAPWKYELELDEEGWVEAEQLIEVFSRMKKWKSLSIEHLLEMIEQSEKKRHEIKNGKIRAFYGHSIAQKIVKEEKEPPAVLYHGTSHRALENIVKTGLMPQQRQYVHLSQDVETATLVGKRRDSDPVILQIQAGDAYRNGIKFYYGNEKVWLADRIPPKYISE